MLKSITWKDFCSFSFFIIINLAILIQFSQLGDSASGKTIISGLLAVSLIPLIFQYFFIGTLRRKDLIFILFLVIVSILYFANLGNFTVLKIFLCVLATKGLTIKKVITYNTLTMAIVFLLIVLSSFIGITSIYYSGILFKWDAVQTAYVFGFNNPNTPPSIIFVLLSGYNLLHKKIKLWVIVVEVLIAILTFNFFLSRTGVGAIVGYSLLILLIQHIDHFKLGKYLLKPFQCSFLLMSILSCYSAIAFSITDVFWNGVNLLLSGRLYLWKSWIDFAGISVFGSSIPYELDALDNGYLYMLIIYGAFMLLFYNYVFLRVFRVAFQSKNWILFATAIMYSVYAFCEKGPLLYSMCNILLIFGTLIMNGQEKRTSNDNTKSEYTVNNNT